MLFVDTFLRAGRKGNPSLGYFFDEESRESHFLECFFEGEAKENPFRGYFIEEESRGNPF